MFNFFKKNIVFFAAAVFLFAGQSASAQDFGLDKKKKTSTRVSASNYANTDHISKLDVIIPVFDPNIPRKDKDGVWPEVRRAEANRFAVMMKHALEKSGAFGAVRVTPDQSGFGELYVHGKILRANGEDIRLEISVNDIRGKKYRILKPTKFKHRVQKTFHSSPRTRGTDAYAPIFDQIAMTIVKKMSRLSKKKAKALNKLPMLTEMRFANMFGPEYFGKHIKERKASYKLVSLPSDDDPVYARIKTIRIQEQLFVDSLQAHYENFNNTMNPHYYAWQEHALPISRERRKAKKAATWKSILGGVAIVAGAASGSDTAATIGVGLGAGLLFSSIGDYRAKNESSKVLDEMGSSLNLDLGAQVIEFEGVQARLEGDAVDQFRGYRTHLLDIYEREATPDEIISR